MRRFAAGVGWARQWFTRLTGVLVLVAERSGVETLADLGQGEIRGELRASEPDGIAFAVAVAGEGDLVSEGVAGGGEASVHPEAGFSQAAEELVFVSCSGDGLPDGFPKCLAGRFRAADAFGFRAFGAGGALCGGAVTAVEDLQAELGFNLAAFGLGTDAVLVAAGSSSVFADEGGYEVDVVVGVTHGDPAACLVVAVFGDAGDMDDAAGGFGPFGVGEVAVAGCGAYGAVPDVPGRSAILRKGEDRVVESVGELLEGGGWVSSWVGGEFRYPGGDQVWVGVFVPAARAVKVVEQSVGAAANGDVRDHGQRLAISMAAASTRAAARRTRATASSA